MRVENQVEGGDRQGGVGWGAKRRWVDGRRRAHEKGDGRAGGGGRRKDGRGRGEWQRGTEGGEGRNDRRGRNGEVRDSEAAEKEGQKKGPLWKQKAV